MDEYPVADNGEVSRDRLHLITAVDLGALGFAAAVAQAVLLREAMAALGGSELSWGVVLAAWLGGMALGAWIGARSPRWGTLGASFALVLTAAGVVLLRAAPAVLGRAPGEVLSLVGALWIWLAAVVPAALAGGFGFATLAESRALGGRAGTAYALESAGAVLGGVAFTFVLAPLGSEVAVLLAGGVVAAASLVARRRLVLATLALVAAGTAAAPTERWLAQAGWRWSGHPGELGAARSTRQQRLELSAGVPAALYADGRLVAVLPDPYRAAPRAHLLALLHPAPRRVLLLGAVPGDLDPFMLRHPVERLDLVIEDKGLLDVLAARNLLPPLSEDEAGRRLLRVGEPLQVVRELGPWDLVILADADPFTLRQHRTRSLEMLQACATALAPGGVLAMRVGVSDTYLGGLGGRLLAVLTATVRGAFPAVRAIPGEEVWLLASSESTALHVSPELLASRWQQRQIEDPVFSAELIEALLESDRAAALDAFVSASSALSTTASHPRAVLLAAARSAGRTEGALGRLLAGAEEFMVWPLSLLVTLWGGWLVLGGLRRRVSRVGVAAAVGFCSMGWWLLLMAAWQGTRGSVYEEVGALGAVFMGGLALASRFFERASALRRLPAVLVGGLAVSLAIAAGWPWQGGGWWVPPLLLVSGAVTGGAFPGLARLSHAGAGALGAARVFAADELGAAVGALLLGLLALPLLGVSTLALMLGGLCLAAAGGVLLGRPR